jgi:hypothetical protein
MMCSHPYLPTLGVEQCQHLAEGPRGHELFAGVTITLHQAGQDLQAGQGRASDTAAVSSAAAKAFGHFHVLDIVSDLHAVVGRAVRWDRRNILKQVLQPAIHHSFLCAIIPQHHLHHSIP